MKLMRQLFFLITMLLVYSTGFSQQFSNRGKEFWTGCGLHYFMELGQNNSQDMVLYFSAEEAAKVRVTIKGTSTTTVQNYSVPANSVIASSPMPKSGAADTRLYDYPSAYGGQGSDRLFDKSIHIESDVPIVAYAHISGAGSSGATMLMPVESWGYSYLSVNSQQAVRISVPGDGCYSWLFVVSDRDNTVVEITPSVPLRNGAPANVPFTTVLNRGQIYQVVGAAIDGANGQDLTGTKVKSVANNAGECFPVAVFAGSSSTAITCDGGNSGFADNLIQQIFPTQAWGKTYLTAPFSSSDKASDLNTGIFRVAVKDPLTIVKKNGVVLTGLKRNFYYEFTSNTADYIEADKPILVTQYMPSMTDNVSNTGCDYKGMGDPEMIYLSPIEQAINRVGFYRNTEAVVEVNYLTLIIPTAGISSLTIDGSNVVDYSYPHPNLAGYSVVVKRWVAAKAQCQVKSDSAFTSITYGLGKYDSYGYNGGTMINNLNGTLSLHNSEGDSGVAHPYACINSPVEISVLMAYQPDKLVWHLTELDYITPKADLTQNNPVAVDTVEIKGVTYYKYTLPGAHQFTQAGKFRFTISSTNAVVDNCNNTEKIFLDVEVRDLKLNAAFKYAYSGCISDSVRFTWNPTNTAGYTVNKWLWNFDDGTTATGDNAGKLYTSTGAKDVRLKIVTVEGCIADSSMKIKLEAPAVMSISATPIAICENGTIDFAATSVANGNAVVNGWYWDFGNGQTSTIEKPQDITYSTAGNYTIKLVGKIGTGAGCNTDTVTKIITVNANPTASFSYPAGCLPANGLVAFTSTATATNGGTITKHAWNFGDKESTTGNPNTAAIANPSHTFKFGNYDILYSVTTDKGCVKDTLVKASFNLSPQMTFAALPGICENGGTISIAKASVTNGVPGTGIYKGLGVVANGTFNPTDAGVGKHIVWFIFSATSGCIDSISSSITVWAEPVVNFTVSDNICLGKLVTITDKSQNGTAPINTWAWDFGNSTNAVLTNGNPFTKNYTTEGSYVVGLIAGDANGCASTRFTQTVVIHPIPKAAFTLPIAVCMPGGEALFTNTSNVTGNGQLNYQWNFGDGSAVSTEQSPLHIYKTIGSYAVNLKATSEFGCTKNVTQNLSSFSAKPTAKFTVLPTAVCQGTDQIFTDASTSPNSTVTKWEWDFGNNTKATERNPVKRYTSADTYAVSLAVVNAEGCKSDTFSSEVTVYPQPVVDAGPSVIVAKGTVVTFSPIVNQTNGVVFSWSPAVALNNPNILRPSYTASQNLVFTLLATSVQGNCTASDQVEVKIFEQVKVPNAFSPNSDGINDTWQIVGLSFYTASQLQIFDRYGQLVFTSTGYAKPWDGLKAGKPLPVGVYYYIIDLKDGKEKMTGSVTILK